MIRKKLYIAIDVQNDFISGSLGSDWAKRVTPNIAKFLSMVKDKEDTVGIWATRDTHFNKESVGDEFEKDGKKWNSEVSEDCWYENTLEGKKLPVEHCIKDTWGWEIDKEVMKFVTPHRIYDKRTFMSYYLGRHIGNFMKDIKMDMSHEIGEIVLMGFCTSICVISNALYLRGLFPDIKITVLEDLCACVTEDTHKAALTTMGCCQIDIENSEEFLKKEINLKKVMPYNSCRNFERKTALNQYRVIIVPATLAEVHGYNPPGERSVYEKLGGFIVKSYKNGEEIESDKRIFLLGAERAKREAGRYALELENFYNHLQED